MKPCNLNKITGWKRDGFCRSYPDDRGSHTVCVVADDRFLRYTLSKGNDLITPNYNFPGLKAGDRWCVCLERWFEAYLAGAAPKIIPAASDPTSIRELERRIKKGILQSYFVDYRENYQNEGCIIF